MRGFINILAVLFISARPIYAQAGLQQKIEQMAARSIQAQCSQCVVDVELKWMSNALTQLDSSRVFALQFDDPGLPRGYRRARVFTSLQNEAVQLYIKLMRKVPVAKERINRTEAISPERLAWKMEDLSRMPRLPLFGIDELKGKTAGRMIQKGSPFFASDLKAPPVIRAGEHIQMLYRQDDIQLVLSCTARQAAAVGERIRLYSKETGKTYIGTVLTSSKVSWEQTL